MPDFKKYEEELLALRREFHKYPELSLKEYETSKRIKNYLKSYGIEDIRDCIETGIIADIYGEGEKTVAIRMDIDALNVSENTNLPFKSVNQGIMHACGHDGHIAIGIILAKIFSENRGKLKGNIKFIFQPAEEEGDGALKMLDAGALNPKPDYIVSGHLWPEIETGKIDITDKITFAAADVIEVRVKGKGGHGALPHTVKDPIYAGSKAAIALKELGIELNKKGIKNILSICSFDCKSQYNIFRNDAFLMGTLRTVDNEEREYIINEMKNICKKIADENGVEIDCEVIVNCPALVNDSSLVKIAREAIEEKMGKDIFEDFGSVMASEDFSYFSNLVPSVHLKIGSGGERAVFPILHNSRYELDERSLLIGVEAIYTIIEKILDN